MNVFVEQQQEKLVRAGLLLSFLIWTKFGYFSGPKIRATTCFPEYPTGTALSTFLLTQWDAYVNSTEFSIKSVFIRYSLLFGNYLAGFQQRIKVFFCHKEEVYFDVETHFLFLRAESERLAAERLLEEAKSLIEVTNTYHSCPPTRSQMIRMRRSGWTRSRPRWT